MSQPNHCVHTLAGMGMCSICYKIWDLLWAQWYTGVTFAKEA